MCILWQILIISWIFPLLTPNTCQNQRCSPGILEYVRDFRRERGASATELFFTKPLKHVEIVQEKKHWTHRTFQFQNERISWKISWP